MVFIDNIIKEQEKFIPYPNLIKRYRNKFFQNMITHDLNVQIGNWHKQTFASTSVLRFLSECYVNGTTTAPYIPPT